MLTEGGAKLLDFGLARLRASEASRLSSAGDSFSVSQTAPGIVVGTLRYMAPEQLEGKEVDLRVDIFAFGAVLYEMLTGKKAFDGAEPGERDLSDPVVQSPGGCNPPAADTTSPRTSDPNVSGERPRGPVGERP